MAARHITIGRKVEERVGGKVEERVGVKVEEGDKTVTTCGVPKLLSKFTVATVDPKGKPLTPPTPLPHVPPGALAKAWLDARAASHHGRVSIAAPRPPAVGLEAMSPQAANAVHTLGSVNLLGQAVYTAFYKHHPLRLSPDVIWLTIAQGFANHVNNNAETLRHKFVPHEGKKAIVVERRDFVKGCPTNDWVGVFPEFSDKIAEHIGTGTRAMIECDFTTTSPTDKICSHITLMDSMQEYFHYVMLSGCGLPEIQLTGTVQDWESIRARAAGFSDYGLDWWLKELLPVLDEFVLAAKGSPNLSFWKSMCNKYGGSSLFASAVSGWVQTFFPYLVGGRKNGRLGEWRGDAGELEPERTRTMRGPARGVSVRLEDFPASVSCAPFVYADAATGKSYSMTFQGGLVAVTQDPDTLTLEVQTGWAVVDHGQGTDAFTVHQKLQAALAEAMPAEW